MQYAAALLAFVATVSAQTATGTPPSCSTDFPQLFEIAAVNVSTAHKRDFVERRGIHCQTIPYINLKGGVMTDQNNRTAEIVANHQFQFDVVLQDPRFYTAGFSVCQNNTLALGGSAVFWQCNSGDIKNIYDQSLGLQCYEIYLDVYGCDSVDASQVSGTIASPMPSATSPATSATTSAITSATTSASPAPSTPATTSASSAAPTIAAPTTAATTSSLPGPAIPSPAPFPKGNSTTAAGAPSASAPAPAPATSSVLTAPASGASVVTIGSTFGLLAAALIAFVML